ncbi:MAG: GvpL/GvpF family gas vesicle protein, partial [Candidatus Zixiibacteriota bacterium]
MCEDKALETVTTDKANAGSKDKATYLYGLAEGGAKTSLGKIGLAGEEVYTIPFNDLCAVVHTCPPEPYKSEDNEVVKRWVLTHEKVVEIAWERFGTILPAGFDTIIKGQEDDTSEENIKKWLKQEYTNLKVKLDKIRGRAEYVVHIFWDPMDIAEEIA